MGEWVLAVMVIDSGTGAERMMVVNVGESSGV